MRFSLPRAIALFVFIVSSTGLSQNAPIAEPESIAPLGTGALTVEISTMRPGSVLIAISNSVPNLGAVLLDNRKGEALALLVAKSGKVQLPESLSQNTPLATSRLDSGDLDDTAVKLAIAADGSRFEGLRLTLFQNGGLVVPFNLKADPAAGVKLTLTFAGTNCYWIEGSCAAAPPCPSCVAERKECCTRPRGGCLSCPGCALDCEPCFPGIGGC